MAKAKGGILRRASIWSAKKFGKFLLFELPNALVAGVIVLIAYSLWSEWREAMRFERAEIRCLALNVYWESHRESEAAQRAVALTTRERVRNRRYGNTYCQVVYEENQFSWTNGSAVSRTPANRRNWRRALRIARAVYHGRYDFPRSWNCRPMFYKRADNRFTSARGRGFFERRVREGKMRRVGTAGAHAFYCLSTRIGQAN